MRRDEKTTADLLIQDIRRIGASEAAMLRIRSIRDDEARARCRLLAARLAAGALIAAALAAWALWGGW